jgi:[acyl-carrier-protein] S-malonyltransferase
VQAASEKLKAMGAKRVLPLQVHGAFHSGLMADAEHRLAEYVNTAPLVDSSIGLTMNVNGALVQELSQVRHLLLEQVTHPVRWEQCVRAMMNEGVDLFIEIGPGKTLTGLNKRIGVTVPTLNVEKVSDLETLHAELSK